MLGERDPASLHNLSVTWAKLSPYSSHRPVWVELLLPARRENYKADAQPCLPWGVGPLWCFGGSWAPPFHSQGFATGSVQCLGLAGIYRSFPSRGDWEFLKGRVPIALSSGSSSDPWATAVLDLVRCGAKMENCRNSAVKINHKAEQTLLEIACPYLYISRNISRGSNGESAKNIDQDHELNSSHCSLAILADCWTQTYQWTQLTNQHRFQAFGESLCLEGLRRENLGPQSRILSRWPRVGHCPFLRLLLSQMRTEILVLLSGMLGVCRPVGKNNNLPLLRRPSSFCGVFTPTFAFLAKGSMNKKRGPYYIPLHSLRVILCVFRLPKNVNSFDQCLQSIYYVCN